MTHRVMLLRYNTVLIVQKKILREKNENIILYGP
jgi:hypothetical protein